MTWQTIEPYRYTGHSRALRPACTASISLGRKAAPGGPEQRMRLQIMFRPGQMASPPAWLRDGATCVVAAGWGADHGRLRLEAGALYKVARLGGRCETGGVRIIVPLPLTLLSTVRRPTAMEMQQVNSAIIITMPETWRSQVTTLASINASVARAGGRGMFT